MKTTYSISINQTDDQGQPVGNLSMTTTDQADLMRLLKNAGIGSNEEEQWSDDPADQGVCPVCHTKPCGCNDEVEEDYANEPKPEVVSTPGGNEFGERRAQQDQRGVTARQGDNPIKNEDITLLAKKLEEQYLKEWNTEIKEIAPALAALGAAGRATMSGLSTAGRAISTAAALSSLAGGSSGSSDNADSSDNVDTTELGKYAAEKAINPYAVGMAAAKKKFGYGTKPAHDLPKKVVTKGHEIAKKVMAKEDELDEFLDANVTVSGVKGNQSTSTSSKGGSSNVSGITSTGTGGDATGGAATGGNAGASNKAGANAKEAFDVGTQKVSQAGGNTTSNVSGVNITGQGGQGGNATATGGNAASSARATNATQQGKNNKLTQEDQVEEEPNEGNEFSGALAKAKAAGAKEFEVDGKKYQVKEGKKPDFLDIDKDGDKKEPMDKAAKEKDNKEEVKESSPELAHLKALINWAPKHTQVTEVTEDMINQGTTGNSELDWLKAVVKYQPR